HSTSRHSRSLHDALPIWGPLPVDAARQAADRGVRIYTIGIGTTSAQQLVCKAEQLGGDVFSDGFGGWGGGGVRRGGPRRYLLLDEPTLQEMAEVTGGEYFRAENAEQLYDVFAELPNEVVFQTEHVEISFLFTLIGAVLLVIAIGLGVLWFR